jgi:hypothetical protein
MHHAGPLHAVIARIDSVLLHRGGLIFWHVYITGMSLESWMSRISCRSLGNRGLGKGMQRRNRWKRRE